MFSELKNIDPLGIYWDSNENNYGRSSRLNQYLDSLNRTYDKHRNLNRLTTSNGEYFYYTYFQSMNLPEGDYYHNGTLIEWKSYQDLIDSIPERLDKQVDNVLKDSGINQYIIISPLLENFNFQISESDQAKFEDLKNYFLQYIPFHIHFIPATSEPVAFRDMINIWRCGQSPINLHALNYRYRLNPFLNRLAILPCLNHNQAMAIFKKYPFTHDYEIHNLTKEMLSEVRFGKKRCGESKASEIITQIRILFPMYPFKKWENDLNNPAVRKDCWNSIKQGG